jgi:hypothetical protein
VKNPHSVPSGILLPGYPMSRASSLILVAMSMRLCNQPAPARQAGPKRNRPAGAPAAINVRAGAAFYWRFTSVSSPLSALTFTEKFLPPRTAAKL